MSQNNKAEKEALKKAEAEKLALEKAEALAKEVSEKEALEKAEAEKKLSVIGSFEIVCTEENFAFRTKFWKKGEKTSVSTEETYPEDFFKKI